MSTRLFIGNIPSGTLEDDLKKEFEFYGKVIKVDLKEKSDLNDKQNNNRLFAFITLESNNLNINKCIQEFSEQKWNGSFLKVSIAKESFLERLKRERAEAESSKEIKIEESHLQLPKHDIDVKKNYNNYDDHLDKEDDYQKKKYNSSDDVIISKDDAAPKKMKIRKSVDLLKNSDSNVVHKTVTNSLTNLQFNKIEKVNEISNISDKKRLESIQNMKSAYNEKKSLIKMALSGIDTKRNNKIIFDDDINVVSNNSYRNNKGSADFSNKISGKKAKLFDDESDDGNDTYNFELKQQFEGESGRKLLELQSRYQSDKRFVLDERFLDVDDNKMEVENDSQEMEVENNDEIDVINEDEKLKQIQILQGIVGESKVISNKADINSKKLPLKTMLRFDPSRPDHTKFLNQPTEKSKKSKKEKKKEMNSINEKERPEVNAAPEVSHERYYKINESLKQSIDDKQPFSLISLFGNKNFEDVESPGDVEYSTKSIEKSKKKLKNPLNGEKNPFFYDTSDSENEDSKKEKTESSKNVLNDDSTVKSTAIIENFFFSDKDSRLIEGLEFFLNTKPSTEKSRRDLKSVVKKRIQNNKRNSKYQPKKVSNHSKPRRFKKR